MFFSKIMKIFWLLVCLPSAYSVSNSFDGFKVLRLMPFTREQMNYLSGLEREDSSLDFWKGVNNAGNPVGQTGATIGIY